MIFLVILGLSLFGVLGPLNITQVVASPADIAWVQVGHLSVAPAAVAKGQTGVVLFVLNFTADGGEGTINLINLTCTGAFGAISKLKLVRDDNNNTRVDGGEYTIGEKDAASVVTFGVNASGNSGLGGRLNFTASRREWHVLVVADISSTASIGDSFAVELSSLSDVDIYKGSGAHLDDDLTAQAGTSAPYSSGIVSVEATGSGALLLDVSQLSDTNVVANSQNVKATALTFTAYGYDVVVSKIGFNLIGTAWSGNISSLAILDEAGAAVSGSWSGWSSTSDATAGNAFTFTTPVTITAGSSKVYYLYFNVSETATTGAIIKFRVRQPANVTATSNDWSIKALGKWLIAPKDDLSNWGPGKMDTATFTIRDRGALEVSALINPSDGNVARGTTFTNITTMAIKALYEDLNVTMIGLNLSGPAGDAWPQNISAINLYNVNASAYLDGSWSGWSSTSDPRANNNFTITNGLTIERDKVVVIRVDVAVNETATPGKVIQLGINGTQGESYVNATGLTSGLVLNAGDKSFAGAGISSAQTILASGQIQVQNFITGGAVAIYVGATKENVTTIPIKALYENLNLTSISFNSTNYADISSLKLYNVNASAYVDGTWSSWVGGGINFTITNGLTIEKGKVVVLRLDAVIKETATPGHAVTISMQDVGGKAFYVNATGLSSKTDLNAGDKTLGAAVAQTLNIVGKLTITGTSQAPTYVTAGQKASMLKLYLESKGETVKFTIIKVQLNGTATPGNYSKVHLYLDNPAAGTVGSWDAADSLIKTGTIAGTTVTFDITTSPINTNSTVFIVAEFAANAKAGATSIISIHDPLQGADIDDVGFLSGADIDPTLVTVTSNAATIQESALFAYVADTLSPIYAHQGESGLVFSLQLNKTIEGSPSCTLSTSTYFKFTDGTNEFKAYLSGTVSFDAGIQVKTLTFASADMPATFAAGYYNATVSLSGTDANSAPIALDVAVSKGPNGALLVDNTKPSIVHDAITSVTAGVKISVNATVTDAASGVDRVLLYYRKVGDASYNYVVMLLAGANTYTADIPANYVTSDGVQYYIEAKDYAKNYAYAPTTAPTTPYSVTVTVTDTTAPTITHTAVTQGYAGVPIAISADVTDNVAVASVTLYYKVTGAAAYTSAAMSLVSGNTYSATIPASAVTTAGIEYYIVALDTSGNSARAPATGAYSITVSQFVVTASTPALKDTEGNVIANATAGTQVLLTTKLYNRGSVDKSLLYIVQVKNAAGTVVFLSFVSGTVPAGAEYEFGIAWTPSAAGTYTVEAFAWKSWAEPEAFSEVSSSSVLVV